MQAFIALFALVAVANAGVVSYGLAHTGTSVQHRSQDTVGNYAFGYNEGHVGGGTYRKEVGDAFGNKAGSYGLTGADGRVRVVNYVADAAGFRADIKSNEPGVGATLQDPAHTSINKALIAAPAAHIATYAAPAAHIASYAAPAAIASYAAPAAHIASYAAPAAHIASYAAPAAIASYAAAPAHYAGINHLGLSHYSAGLPISHGIGHYAAGHIAHGIGHYAAGHPIAHGIGHYAAGLRYY